MNYKLISPSNYFTEKDLLETVCRNREVDINIIKNPSLKSIINPLKLERMQKAIGIVMTYRNFGGKFRVGIVVDSDA